MNLMYTYGVLKNRISLNRFVQIMSASPAKIFGMYPRKGTIAPGSDADLVLFDPHRENVISAKTSRQRCDYSAFEGWKTQGEAVSVLTRGEWALKDGKAVIRSGAERFVKRSRYPGDENLAHAERGRNSCDLRKQIRGFRSAINEHRGQAKANRCVSAMTLPVFGPALQELTFLSSFSGSGPVTSREPQKSSWIQTS